jgi:hypothetical protein
MDSQKEILKQEMQAYVGVSPNATPFAAFDDTKNFYTVIIFDYPPKHDPNPFVALAARIVAGKIVIEADRTDKPLVEALTAAGVPRDHIVLAYAGESRPDAEQLAANWPPENTQG